MLKFGTVFQMNSHVKRRLQISRAPQVNCGNLTSDKSQIWNILKWVSWTCIRYLVYKCIQQLRLQIACLLHYILKECIVQKTIRQNTFWRKVHIVENVLKCNIIKAWSMCIFTFVALGTPPVIPKRQLPWEQFAECQVTLFAVTPSGCHCHSEPR